MTKRLTTTFLVIACTLVLSACSDDDNIPPPPAATTTPTRTSPPTATPTAPPAATATATAAASSTATVPPTATSSPTITPTTIPPTVLAFFNRDPLDPNNPFPSDRQRDDSGRVLPLAAMFQSFLPPDARYDTARSYLASAAQQFTALSGFSTFAPIRVRLSGAATVAIGDEGPAGIFVMRQDNPTMRQSVRVATVTPDVAGDYAIEISPLVPLAPKARYVYAVTSVVRDALGRPVQPDPELTRLLCDEGEPGSLASWRADLAPALTTLAQEGITCRDIVLMDVFTTQATTDDLVTIRQRLDSGSLPVATPVIDGAPIGGIATGIYEEGTPEFAQILGTSTSEVVRAVAVGRFASFDFRGANRAFDPNRVSGAVQPSAPELAFYVALPKAPAPAGGYPLVIYGHGLGGSGLDALRTATTNAADTPMVWVGISDVSHGHRGNFLAFFSVSNVLATRDNFRQTIADYLQLQRMIRYTDHPLFADVDREHFYYFGVSLGGIMGGLYMGVEPDVGVGMLSVPGGGLPRILNGSELISGLLNPLIGLAFGVTPEDAFYPVVLHRFVQVAQWSIDPGDPINTAQYVLGPDTLPGVPPKSILLHEGVTDSVVPNNTTEDLIRAMGLQDLKAAGMCMNSSGCSGAWRFVMTEYDQPSDCGHLISFVLPEAVRQSYRYLFSDGTFVEDGSPRLQPDERPECPDLTEELP